MSAFWGPKKPKGDPSVEEAILDAAAKLAAIEKRNCIELWVHPDKDLRWFRDVARFYTVETCRGRYVVPFHLHKTSTLRVYCAGPRQLAGQPRRECPGGGYHDSPVSQVVWPLGALPVDNGGQV